MKQFNVTDFLINHYRELEIIDNGMMMPNLAISADIQSGGRGRYNRNWSTKDGNLAISYCLKNEFERPEQLCYVAVISLHEVLLDLGVKNAELKWVNDILVGGCKISGILIEGYKEFVIVGIGCNIYDFYGMSALNATSLQSEGIDIINVDLIEKLTHKFSENIQHYKSYGFAKFKNYWLEYAYKLGEEVIVNLSNKKKIGIFKTIDDEGKLVLEIDGICHSISAGELFDL